MRLERRAARLLAVLLSLALVTLAACSDDDGDGESSDTTSEDGGTEELEGDIVVSGSSTVQPISTAAGEAFQNENPGVGVTVDGPGTSDGFEAFCAGDTDINDASRPIDEEDEVPLCEDNGIEYTELRVGIDGITVMTSPANSDIDCLTFADLYALIGPEAEDFENWSDAQALATELGSSSQLPDAPLDIYGPGEESGTYGSFIEIALADIAEARLEAGAITEDQEETTRSTYSANDNDNQIIGGIEGGDSTLGWVGFAFAEEAGDGVKILEVDDGESGCVAPTAETIAAGEYPLSRDLYIYVNTGNAADSPALAAFVDYYLNDGITAVEEEGYVALEPAALDETRAAWESARP